MWKLIQAHFHCLNKFDLYANDSYDDKETKTKGRKGRTALSTPVNTHTHIGSPFLYADHSFHN